MKEHKIFKPDIVFHDYVKSSWSQNIREVEHNVPINVFLKERGIFALDIDPHPKEVMYVFGLPVNKGWGAETFDKDSYISFEIYSEEKIEIDLIFQDVDAVDSLHTKVVIDENSVDLWKKFRFPVLTTKNLRLILFSGSAVNTPNYAIKDIVIESPETPETIESPKSNT